MGDEYDLFKFSNSGKIKAGGSLMAKLSGSSSNSANIDIAGKYQKSSKSTAGAVSSSSYPASSEDYSGEDFDDDDDDDDDNDERKVSRRHWRKKNLSAASRLLSKRDQEEEEPGEITPNKKKRAKQSSPSPSPPVLSPSFYYATSPQPSPPPPGPGVYTVDTPTDNNSRKVLNQANDVLNRLRCAASCDVSSSSDFQDVSEVLTPTPSSVIKESMNLRVRFKGKVHKYTVEKDDPFSGVIALLAGELKVDEDGRILLSHKTATIKPTDSPATLSLTTADIIDAVVMTGASLSQFNDSQNSASGDDNITIKVQTPSQKMVYRLSKDDPLQKILTAFASKLDVSISKLKFSFDGDDINPSQTAQDLDMENDDCIDVIVMKA